MDTTRLIIVAVGGQGNLLASKVLGEAALLADVPVRMSEIHGMAQRGGVVESAIVFGDAKSTIISDGEADVLVGFEPSETLRAINKCSADTVVVTNLAPLPPFTVALGKSKYPDLEQLQDADPAKNEKTGRLRFTGPGQAGRQPHGQQHGAAGRAHSNRRAAVDRRKREGGHQHLDEKSFSRHQPESL